ncbi:MAG: ribosome biogenesis GTP-binding protein YihA/YsxC [Burkholderiaceae bacterium]
MGARLQTARFSVTVVRMRDLPRDGLAEVAFAGRSNAGKSSAINRLCERRRLAFPSKTPGRTQALNYFAVGPADAANGYLVDTPGYGYAAVPHEVKHSWQALAGSYLRQRDALVGVVLMVDCRRGLGDKDSELLDWIRPDVPCLILLTKADKLSRMQQGKALDALQRAYAQQHGERAASFLLFSAQTGLGVEPARSLIESWLEVAPSDD